VSVVQPTVESSSEPESAGQRGRSWPTAQWLVLALYLLGALALTARLWLDPAGRAQTQDPNDVNQVTWFVRYAAVSISHFHLPALVTTGMNPPHGVNLMWNTSILLPGVLLTPITLLAGPQVSLTVALTLGLAGSAASLFWVLRRWGASTLAAGLGGALYGFSPALVASGIGHYHLVLAMLPPLLIHLLLRIVTGRSRPVRSGLWLGLLIAAQLFIGEEALIDTVIAGLILVVVLMLSRPRAVPGRLRDSAIGLAVAGAVALVLCGRALWVQFRSGGIAHATGATTVIHFAGGLQHLYMVPYALVTPSSAQFFHTTASALSADGYPEPSTEYLAYLGFPLIIVLIVATVWFWRDLRVRIAGVSVLALELISLGSAPVAIGGYHIPAPLLPWYYLQHLPVLKSALPDRLAILADGAAAVVLAFGLDLARQRAADRAASTGKWQNGAAMASAAAVLALLPLIPVPYGAAAVPGVPSGWQATFSALHLTSSDRVLVVPVPNGVYSDPMRWYGDTAEPGSMIGGDFITPNEPITRSRSGRGGETAFTKYLDALSTGTRYALSKVSVPSKGQIDANLASWQPSAVMAVTSPGSPLGRYLTRLFGSPVSHIGSVLGWRLKPFVPPAS
jgi:hypothetical protein